MAKKALIFGGFGTSTEIWKQQEIYHSLLKKGFRITLINTIDDPLNSLSARFLKGYFDLVICHSLGFHHFLYSRIKARNLILISIFVDFCAGDELRLRQLQRMQQQFRKYPLKVLKTFQTRMLGHSNILLSKPLGIRKREILQNQLDELQISNLDVLHRIKFCQHIELVLFENDPIVPTTISMNLQRLIPSVKMNVSVGKKESVHLGPFESFLLNTI